MAISSDLPLLGVSTASTGSTSGGKAGVTGASGASTEAGSASGAQNFATLLPGAGTARAGAAKAGGGTQAATGEAASGTSAPGGYGVTQQGASASELLATRVRLAQGLRAFEAETLQALKAAGSDTDAKTAVLKGAAQALGALLGQTDAALGTDMTDRLQTLMGRLTEKSDGKSGGAEADPTALAGALFALVAQTLGLVRAGTNAQPTRSQLLLDALVAQGGVQDATRASAGATKASATGLAAQAGATQAGAVRQGQVAQKGQTAEQAGQDAAGKVEAAEPDPSGPLGHLVRSLAEAARDARQAGQQSHVTAGDKAGEGKTGHDKAGANSSGQAGQVQLTRTADPFAQMLRASAEAGGAAMAGGAASPAAAGSAAGAAVAASSTAAQAATASTAAPAAAFAGFVANQIRSANVSDGVTRIALKPQGLGEIELDMKRDTDGRLNVVLRVENPMVLSALRHDQLRLAEMFSASGLGGQGAQASLDFESFGERGGQGTEETGGQIGAVGAALSGGEDMSEPADSAAQIGRGALDIRI